MSKKIEKIELVKAKTFELDPDKFYMAFINMPKSGLSMADLAKIQFPKQTQANLLLVGINEDPNDVIEIIEVQTYEPTTYKTADEL
jgi:hypothetical protein